MNGLVAYIKLPHTMSKLLSRGTSWHSEVFTFLKSKPLAFVVCTPALRRTRRFVYLHFECELLN